MRFSKAFIEELHKLAEVREWRKPRIEREQALRRAQSTVRVPSSAASMEKSTMSRDVISKRPPPIRRPLRKPVSPMTKVTPPTITPKPGSPF